MQTEYLAFIKDRFVGKFDKFSTYSDAKIVKNKLDMWGLWARYEGFMNKHCLFMEIPKNSLGKLFHVNALVVGTIGKYEDLREVMFDIMKCAVPTGAEDGSPYLFSTTESLKNINALVVEMKASKATSANISGCMGRMRIWARIGLGRAGTVGHLVVAGRSSTVIILECPGLEGAPLGTTWSVPRQRLSSAGEHPNLRACEPFCPLCFVFVC